MIATLKLLLPALVPSWHFFKAVGASPRIEWTPWSPNTALTPHWQEFRPRPTRVSPLEIAKRMFWNPEWNETLFLVSCAERWADNGTEHSLQEIANRVALGLRLLEPKPPAKAFRFRILLVSREETEVTQEVIYTSAPRLLRESTSA